MSPITRLTRVRQRQEYNTGQQRGTGHHGEEVMLFEDYAVIDRKDKSFLLGNLVRLQHQGKHGVQDYKKPVSYKDPKKSEITAYLQMYKETNQPSVYEHQVSPGCSFPFTDIMTHVNLSIMEDGKLQLPSAEQEQITSEVQKLLQPAPQHRSSRRSRASTQTLPDEGVTRTVVQPDVSETEAQGIRRSTRTRTVLHYSS